MKNVVKKPWFWAVIVLVVLIVIGVWYAASGRSSAHLVYRPQSPSPSPSPSASATPTPTPTPVASQAAGTSACTSAQLSFKVGAANGAAGSSYSPIVFTNSSSTACTMQGFPTVTLLNSSGAQIGQAAAHDTSKTAALVTLAPGASASATVVTHSPGAYPSGACSEQSAQVKAIAPGQSQAFAAPFSAYICESWMVSPIAAGSNGF